MLEYVIVWWDAVRIIYHASRYTRQLPRSPSIALFVLQRLAKVVVPLSHKILMYDIVHVAREILKFN